MKRIKENPYICLTILILLTGIVLYAPFIFGKYIFAYADWGYDSKHSFLPIYEYYAQRMTDFRWDNYDFSYGLGTSVFANIFNALDPFNMLNIFLGSIIGEDKVGYFLIVIHWIKNLAMGIMGIFYLRLFDISNKVCVVSSYALAFCGFIMITGQHYQFSTFAVLFMLLTIICEMTIRNEKWWIAMFLCVAVVGMMGPYPMFQTLIALGIYCIVRLIQREDCIKNMAIKLFRLIGIMLLGLLASMFAFLPQCYEIMCVSSRISGEKSIWQSAIEAFSFLPKEYLKAGFLRLFSNNLEGLINSWEGPRVYFSTTPFYFSLFFPFCIAQSITHLYDKTKTRKSKIIRGMIIMLMVFIFACKFIPALSNMFSYVEYRFVFVLLPCFLICFAESLEDLLVKKTFNIYICLLTIIISIMLLWHLFDSQNAYSVLTYKVTIILFLIIGVITISIQMTNTGRRRELFEIILFITISASLCFDSGVSLYAERSIVTKDDYANNYQMPYLKEFSKIISEKEGDNFIRVDRTFLGYDGSPDIAYAFICPVRTVSVYNSTLSKYTTEFVNKLMKKSVATQIGYSLNSYGVWYNTHIADLLGLKYIISQQNSEHTGWEMIAEYNGYYLYCNKKMNTAGLLYDTYITNEEYEELDEAQQAIVTRQAVILDKDILEAKNKTEYKYEVINSNVKYLKLENDYEIDLSECINKDVLKNGDSHDYFIGIEYTGAGTYQLKNEKMEVIDTGNLETSVQGNKILIPITADVKTVALIPNENTEISCTDVQICNMELNYCNVSDFYNNAMGNVVEGTVSVGSSQILYMPITYDKNWSVYVNGEKKEIIRANYGFMGVTLNEGINNVKFVYYNYSMYVGTGISIITCLVIIVFGYVQKKNRRSEI